MTIIDNNVRRSRLLCRARNVRAHEITFLVTRLHNKRDERGEGGRGPRNFLNGVHVLPANIL